MYIYVIDESEIALANQARRAAERQPDPKTIIMVNNRWEMERICRRISNHGSGGILVLYILGHGYTFGEPSRIELGRHDLTVGTAYHFEQLRNLWIGEYPRIELHSCYVASETPPLCRPRTTPEMLIERLRAGAEGIGPPRRQVCQPGTPGPAAPGHIIMQALANAAGVTVVAPVNAQSVEYRFLIEGPRRYYIPAVYFRRDQ